MIATVNSLPELGEWLHRLRKGAGMTLKQLTNKAEISYSCIAKVERAQCSPQYETLVRLCDVLGLEIVIREKAR